MTDRQVSDEQVREALEVALGKVGATEGTQPSLVRVRPGERRTAVVGDTLEATRRQVRNPNPPPDDRSFGLEVGHRVMCWSWIENRRGGGDVGDRAEERMRQGGRFLAWHLNGVLVNARTRGE